MSQEETTPDKKHRVLICDDHRMLTDAFASIIELDPRVELVSDPISDPLVALEVAAREQPDVVLMDVHLGPGINGIEATKRMLEVAPEARVVIFTGGEDRFLMLQAVEAGASSFLKKTAPIDELLEVICATAEDRSVIDPHELSALLRGAAKERARRHDAELVFSQLTQREREVLQAVALGRSNDDVAADLVLSPQTIQTHVRNILAKLGVHSKLEAVIFAARHGFITIA